MSGIFSERKMSTFQSNHFKEFEDFQPDKILFPEPPRNERPLHATRLIKNRRAAAKIQEAVKLQIKEFESTQHTLCQFKQKLKSKEVQMRHHMQKNSLLKQSEEQQRIADRDIRCNKELFNNNQHYIKQLKQELSALITEQQQLRKEVEESNVYAKYFERALKKNKQFEEPHEMIAHYNARKRIQQELLAYIEENREEMMKSQNTLEWTRKRHSYIKVSNENKISTLKGKLEKVEQQVLNWEEKWSEVKKTARMKLAQQAYINQATFNLYKNMRHTSTKTSKPVKPQDTMDRLDKVQEFMCDLKLILERVSKASGESPNAEAEMN